MAFVDEITIEARAGRGGDGVVRWLHLKGKEFSGPAGGNGGNGGDVYIRGVRDINLLSRYRGEKKFEAQDGEPGANQNRIGKSGDNLIINVPVGSIVRNRETGESYDIDTEGQSVLVLKGGRGGVGNAVFKSSVNQRPEESTPGARGERAELSIELRLIADAGLIGFPNAGKTSLLNALTHSTGKVGSYAFTTLEPNLGVLYGFVLADIPGLIEGASQGKGLGSKFLRHISRTKLLLHCISLEENEPLERYQQIRGELAAFERGALNDRPELVILTKSDTRDKLYIKEVIDAFTGMDIETVIVSVLEDSELKQLGDRIIARLRVL